MKNKIVVDPRVARELLKRGYTICDIKPDRNDIYHRASVFVFKGEEKLEETIKDICENY